MFACILSSSLFLSLFAPLLASFPRILPAPTVPQFGIQEAYAAEPGMLADALGIYLASWFIVTFVSPRPFPLPQDYRLTWN
jgi:hypothetical protein